MRYWLSFRGPFGTRPGFSICPEDIHPRLPSYRRYGLRHGLQEAAKARGETMTKEDANYAIDKALATGLLDFQRQPELPHARNAGRNHYRHFDDRKGLGPANEVRPG